MVARLSQARENRIDGVIGAPSDAPTRLPERPMGTARIGLYTHPESQWQYRGLESLNGNPAGDQRLLLLSGAGSIY